LDGEADKWCSDDDAAAYFGTSRASIERDPEKPPAIRFGRLKRRSCRAWEALAKRRLEAALAEAAAKAAALAPPGVEPPKRRGPGRPRGSKNKPRNAPAATPLMLDVE
jgi:hypothetical protein